MRLSMRSKRAGEVAVGVALLSLVAAQSATGQAYSVREISLPSTLGLQSVDGVNALGAVAASAFGPDVACSWRKGAGNLLGPLPSDGIALARSINDLGVVVGSSMSAPVPEVLNAVVWDPATGLPRALPIFERAYGTALDINRNGDIVGELDLILQFGDPSQRAVLWPASGGVINLGTPLDEQSFSSACAINELGDIAGTMVCSPGDVAFFRPAGASSTLQPIGTLGGVFSMAEDLNDFGEIVGHSRTLNSAVDQPFRWRAATGTMTGLGTLRGFGANALGTNNRGQVVGYDRGFSSSSPDIAFIVNPGPVVTITDLNTLIPAGSGWTLRRAVSVNNAGEIVGMGRLNGRDAAFVLTPESPAGRPACFADLDRDQSVNTRDLTQLLAEFGRTGFPGDGADVTGDGSVNTADLVFFLAAFGSVCV